MRNSVFILIFVSFFSCKEQNNTNITGAEHPNLILTLGGVESMRANMGTVPLFDQSVDKIRKQVDAEIAAGIDVPLPKDLAGGYTHERHKSNFFTMQKAGVLFQITGDEKYAMYIRDMLLKYAELFPTFDKHPATRSYARGKFFWQCLNDANWLVYTAQAYDCIYDWLDQKTITKLNTELFRPYADYISIQNPRFFNRLHNHSTWGNAAVGMIGLVMNDEELIDRALYAFDLPDTVKIKADNDGGSLNLKGYKEGGFFAQIDHSFSPDGYYTEGPYYQRYAMYPFLIFAQALTNKRPELKILDYRDGLLIKAVYALINQTNSAGEFFPINDSQKGMSLASRELVNAISMAYYYGGKDAALLSLIEAQGRVPLNDSGLAAAKGIAEGLAKPYVFKSLQLTDGAKGDEGAIGILRSKEKELTLVMKYAKHGMGHGHFDELSFLLYDGPDEVIQDYGSARWVNIEYKDGGGYLKENKTWAKQTVAHNTLVINKHSQFDGNVQEADKFSGIPYYFHTDDSVQVVSAKELHAYKGVQMHRTMAVVELEALEKPLVIDLFSVQAPEGTQFDLPHYYKGELMSTSQKLQSNNELTPMGKEFGYQHLWAEAQAKMTSDDFSMTWFNKKKFYTLTTAVQQGDMAILTRIGANDPNFDLRRDPGMILRRVSGNTLFASVIESHGSYSYSDERPINSFASVQAVKVLTDTKDYAAVSIELKNGTSYTFCIAKNNNSKTATHELQVASQLLAWTGPYVFIKQSNQKDK